MGNFIDIVFFLLKLINKVVDVPIINEATEQIIALKAVDVVADYMELELEKAGLAVFFDGVR